MAEIGTILGGRYRLVELLGQGGMATIFRAVDTQLGRDVAIKLLRPEYLQDPDFSSRFRQEAQAAASLTHPNVVTVFDYGEDPSGPYIVMEIIDGEDLSTIIRRSGALPPRQATRIAAAVARALAAAHARGLIHRDVKPGNVLIGRDGQVKVVDFGIARAVAEAQVTLPGTTMGSVHYFSPEQARGEPATEASDIYALGIVLYELLTGVRPWEGDSAASVGLATAVRPRPGPDDGPSVRATRSCGDHPQGPGARAAGPIRLGRGDGRCPRSGPRDRRCGSRGRRGRGRSRRCCSGDGGVERRGTTQPVRRAICRRCLRGPEPAAAGRPDPATPRRRGAARDEPVGLGRGHRRDPAARGHRLPGLPARRRRRHCRAVAIAVRVAVAVPAS